MEPQAARARPQVVRAALRRRSAIALFLTGSLAVCGVKAPPRPPQQEGPAADAAPAEAPDATSGAAPDAGLGGGNDNGPDGGLSPAGDALPPPRGAPPTAGDSSRPATAR